MKKRETSITNDVSSIRKCSECFSVYPNYRCCEDVYYCNRSCQNKHWCIHKNYCKKENSLTLKSIDRTVLNIITFISISMDDFCKKLFEHYQKYDSLYIFDISFEVDLKEDKNEEEKKKDAKENQGNNEEGKEEEEEKNQNNNEEKKEGKNEKVNGMKGGEEKKSVERWIMPEINRFEKKNHEKDYKYIMSILNEKDEPKFKIISVFNIKGKDTNKKYLYIYDPRIVKSTFFLNLTHTEFFEKISILKSSFWTSKIVFESYLSSTALEHLNDLNKSQTD
jgi:hypothetical protein